VARRDPTLAFVETTDKGHGRVEVRRYWQTDRIEWFADRGQWEALRSVAMVESVREVKGKQSVERRYYLSSLAVDVVKLARAVRGHWKIENQLHWVLDVVFGEDQSRARTGHAAENLAATRRLAINLLRQDKENKRSLKSQRLRATLDPNYLRQLLAN
jgi:predicted transposase YbfD/YdcC